MNRLIALAPLAALLVAGAASAAEPTSITIKLDGKSREAVAAEVRAAAAKVCAAEFANSAFAGSLDLTCIQPVVEQTMAEVHAKLALASAAPVQKIATATRTR